MEKLLISHRDYSSLMIYRIAHRLEVVQNNVLRQYGVSHQQTQILAYIYARPDQDIFQRDIEHSFGLKSSTVTETLHLLEQKGFVQRMPCEYDRRAKRLTATQKARDLHETFMESVYKIENIACEPLTDSERQILKDLLRKVIANTEKY